MEVRDIDQQQQQLDVFKGFASIGSRLGMMSVPFLAICDDNPEDSILSSCNVMVFSTVALTAVMIMNVIGIMSPREIIRLVRNTVCNEMPWETWLCAGAAIGLLKLSAALEHHPFLSGCAYGGSEVLTTVGVAHTLCCTAFFVWFILATRR